MFLKNLIFLDGVFTEDNSTLELFLPIHKSNLTNEVFYVHFFIIHPAPEDASFRFLWKRREFLVNKYHGKSHFCPFMNHIFIRNNEELTGGKFASPNGRFILDLNRLSTAGLQVLDTARGESVIHGQQVPFDGISIVNGVLVFFINSGNVSSTNLY